MATPAPGKEIDATLLVTAKNPRGIPEVVFIVSLKAIARKAAVCTTWVSFLYQQYRGMYQLCLCCVRVRGWLDVAVAEDKPRCLGACSFVRWMT